MDSILYFEKIVHFDGYTCCIHDCEKASSLTRSRLLECCTLRQSVDSIAFTFFVWPSRAKIPAMKRHKSSQTRDVAKESPWLTISQWILSCFLRVSCISIATYVTVPMCGKFAVSGVHQMFLPGFRRSKDILSLPIQAREIVCLIDRRKGWFLQEIYMKMHDISMDTVLCLEDTVYLCSEYALHLFAQEE